MYFNLNQIQFAIIGLAVSPLLPMLWSARTIVEINPIQKYFREYYWILGIKIGEKHFFDSIDKVYVNQVNKSRRMTSYGGKVSTERYLEYVGFIKLNTGMTHELLRLRNKDLVFKKLEPVVKKLGTTLIDHSDPVD